MRAVGTTASTARALGDIPSKNHVKTVTRHWEKYMEMVKAIRHTRKSRDIYAQRKETSTTANI